MPCGICGNTGHNRHTCKLAATATATVKNVLVDIPPASPSPSVVTLSQLLTIWNILKPIIEKEGPKLFLGHNLLKKEHGNRHGSMGTSAIEEDLWTTVFRKYGIWCLFECTQADCGIKCSEFVAPLSIKCTSSAIALNWGKNKTHVAFKFIAPIFIVWHQKKSNKNIKSGIYIVDPEWCQSNVHLTKNNKTDYLVESKSFSAMLERAKEIGTYCEINASPDDNTCCVYRDPDNRTVEIIKKPTNEILNELRF